MKPKVEFKSAKARDFCFVISGGCIVFLAFSFFCGFKIYEAFKHGGMPVWSGNHIVASVDPTYPILVFLTLSTLLSALIIWRSIRACTDHS